MKRTKPEACRKGPWNALKPTGACVDWITLTASADGSGEALWTIGDRFLRQDEGEGQWPRPWQMKGYRGWHTPHVRVASRKDGVLLSLSGIKSGNKWRETFAAAENCTRLDLAVDVQSDPPVTNLAAQIYRNLNHRPSRTGRPSSSRLIVGSDGGSTVYIGSRQSEYFGRVYDKGVEQQTLTPGHWWRWEVEIKGESATRVADQLRSVDDEGVAIGSIVADWFRSRAGVSFPFESVVALCKWQPEPTTVDQKLLWLSRQVRPTVIELLGRCERHQILRALGLPQSAVAES